jgi:tartrate-resistant acid phosphatase type 5
VLEIHEVARTNSLENLSLPRVRAASHRLRLELPSAGGLPIGVDGLGIGTGGGWQGIDVGRDGDGPRGREGETGRERKRSGTAARRAFVSLALIGSACAQAAQSGLTDLAGRGRNALPATVFSEPEARPEASASAQTILAFAVKGDWGAGTMAQWRVTRRMCRVRDRTSFDVVVTTGDNFYSPDGVATPRTYGNPERCLISDPEHRWVPAWGNHDLGGTSTAQVLGAPGRRYRWSTAEVDVFVLDSNRAWQGRQRRWLARSLRTSPAPVKIAVFHHPPFSVGGHGSHLVVRESWVPLFERHGMDLVLSGHNHLYEHARVRGVDYVVTGGGGARLNGCGEPAPWTRQCLSAHHFVLVTVNDATLSVQAVAPSGRSLDTFTVRA